MDDIIGRTSRALVLGPGRQCTATNRLGQRCQRAPIVGGFVCSMHGGSTPEVQRVAKERMMALVEPAIDVLQRAVRAGDATRCDKCGRGDELATEIRAALAVLDRCGFGPKATLEVAPPPEDRPQWTAYLTDNELDTVLNLIEAGKARFAAAEA